MVKISVLTGQQRLRQLARVQLGSTAQIIDDLSESESTDSQTDHFNDKHHKLAARSGAADTQINLTLAQRAQRRIQMQHERQQQNLERVIALAAEYCPEQVSSQDVDPDWFQQFCDLIINISNVSMQQLWAKILAGEIASPGRFSLKTLHMLQRMSFKEAQALQCAANVTCRIRQDNSARIYFGYTRRPTLWRFLTGRSRAILNIAQYGLTYPMILSLVEIGLIHSTEIESGELSSGQHIQWQFSQLSVKGTVISKNACLQYYKYTPSGAELLPLLSSQANPHYVDALKTLLADIVCFSS